MLELAIAEAYRPRVARSVPKSTPSKSPSFATNPSARPSVFSLRSRPTSSIFSSSSAYSQPRSFKSILSWRKRPNLVLSSTTEVPESTGRSTSVYNSTTEVPKVHTSAEPLLTSASLPQLPPTVPLPPQEELEDFDLALQAAIDRLQTSPLLNIHDQTSTTLSHLAHIADIVSCIATSWPEFWTVLVHAAKLLCTAKVDMSVGVKYCLIGALERVARRWNEEQERGGWSKSTAELAHIVGGAFDEILQQKKAVSEQLSKVFETWLEGHYEGLQRVDSGVPASRNLRILTHAPSSAVFTMLSHALSTLPNVSIAISVLLTPDSTSPSELFPFSPSAPRVHTTVFPAQAVGTACQDVDVLLLHAEAIDSQGNVQSMTGAMGAAACVKTLSPHARIIVLSEADRIIANVEQRGKNVQAQIVFGVNPEDGAANVSAKLLEWVPARFLDMYLMETGVLGLTEITRLGAEADQRERYIFGE
ncbi:hypothetical protein EKO04_001654 [Ascochyta lentis]|uniref:Nagb/rpia/CoA transferase-like protein n=1 Tax=Ascochyta lentis TaxID=205686 RepID=A0A8H7JCJ5_9PLEO|nr:hypothetical protein EKO04_001654 [Ascochyta lentis]